MYTRAPSVCLASLDLRAYERPDPDEDEANAGDVVKHAFVDEIGQQGTGEDTESRCDDQRGRRAEEYRPFADFTIRGIQHRGKLGFVPEFRDEHGGEHRCEYFDIHWRASPCSV